MDRGRTGEGKEGCKGEKMGDICNNKIDFFKKEILQKKKDTEVLGLSFAATSRSYSG